MKVLIGLALFPLSFIGIIFVFMFIYMIFAGIAWCFKKLFEPSEKAKADKKREELKIWQDDKSKEKQKEN